MKYHKKNRQIELLKIQIMQSCTTFSAQHVKKTIIPFAMKCKNTWHAYSRYIRRKWVNQDKKSYVVCIFNFHRGEKKYKQDNV